MNTNKPLRADAERNRRRVLEVAQAVFAAEGLAVPIDEIARRAGLGVGTLYRHFPTKEALFAAIVIGRMEDLVAYGTEALGEPDPGTAFFGFLTRMVMEGAAKKDFMDALASTGVDLTKIVGPLKKEMGRVMAALLERAQASGAVRQDVGIPEVLALVMGAFGSIDRLGGGPAGRERLLAIVLDGLRAPGAPAAPPPNGRASEAPLAPAARKTVEKRPSKPRTGAAPRTGPARTTRIRVVGR